MAVVTDLVGIAGATAVGYNDIEYQKTVQGQTVWVVRLEKQLNPIGKSVSGWFGGYGQDPVQATAQAQAVTSLNNARRHRYAGSPGAPSGATTVADLHGDNNVVDAG